MLRYITVMWLQEFNRYELSKVVSPLGYKYVTFKIKISWGNRIDLQNNCVK